MRMRGTRAPVSVIAVLLLTTGCATLRPPASPQSPCEDPAYLRLRAEEPDSLSEREYERLQVLDEQCLNQSVDDAPAGDRMHGGFGGWLWMPVMMFAGGLMWLMMGG